ncbi:MAG: hypothetical protein Tsb0021_02040 [Chlamydiales bacterium]
MIHRLASHLPPSSLFTTCIYEPVREGQRLDFAQHILHHLGEVIISCSFYLATLREHHIYEANVYHYDFALDFRRDNMTDDEYILPDYGIDANEWERYHSSHGKKSLHSKVFKITYTFYTLIMKITLVATIFQFVFPIYRVPLLFPLKTLASVAILNVATYSLGIAIKIFSYYLSKRVRDIYLNYDRIHQISPQVHFPERHQCALTTSPENPSSALECLPKDIIRTHLLAKLSIKDKIALSQTSRTMHKNVLFDQKTATLVHFSKFFDHPFLNAFGNSTLGEDILYDILSQPALPARCNSKIGMHSDQKFVSRDLHISRYFEPADLKGKSARWGIDKDNRLYFIFLEATERQNTPQLVNGYCMHTIRAARQLDELNEECYEYYYDINLHQNSQCYDNEFSFKNVIYGDINQQTYLGHVKEGQFRTPPHLDLKTYKQIVKPVLNPLDRESKNIPFVIEDKREVHFPISYLTY